jgi:hypothetical protein
MSCVETNTLIIGTKDKISQEDSLKNLEKIKPGTTKVKRNAAKSDVSGEANEAAVRASIRMENQYFCRTAEYETFTLSSQSHTIPRMHQVWFWGV